MSDLEQARAEVLTYCRRLGETLGRSKAHGGDGGDSGTFHDTVRDRNNLDKACVEYAKALAEDKKRRGDGR
jgi:hypothetical protein